LTYKDAKNSYVSYIVKRFDLNQVQVCSVGSKEKLEMHVPQNCFNFILEKIEAVSARSPLAKGPACFKWSQSARTTAANAYCFHPLHVVFHASCKRYGKAATEPMKV
jgi:hypothetical protein